MKREQLSQRIGNIEDRLVEQAENAPSFRRGRQKRSLLRVAAIAAVLVLMVGSFVVGAIAMAGEKQEAIKVGDSGISLILPDTWKGKYGYELDGNNATVYHLATQKTFGEGGVLFQVVCLEGRYPMDYFYPEPGFTIAITETSTYRFIYPSDIQVDINNEVAWAEYDEMSAEIKTINVVMNAQMLASTMNVTNWVKGTVFVSFLNNGEVTKTVDCDAMQSQKIKETIKAQDYSLEQGSFPADLLVAFDGQEYYMNSATGSIENAAGHPYSAVLSAEDLNSIMDLLSD
jgi:hypothetical protein